MDALSARVLISKPVEGGHRIHWLVVERGDPSSDTFERIEVPIEVGILSHGTASVGTMEYRAWRGGHHVGRIPREIREQALFLVFWVFWRRGAGLSLERDPNINTVSAGELLRVALVQIQKNNGV